MRYKKHFSLYPRKNSSGKNIWYYRTYRHDGPRTTGLSTGCTSKTLAIRYCEELYAAGKLIPRPAMEFGTFARGWFAWDSCPYVLDRRGSGTAKKSGITESYARQLRGILAYHILPYFKDMALTEINPVNIRAWRVWLKENREQDGKLIRGISNKTINNAVSCLKIMTDWALDDDLIQKDPLRGVGQLMVDDDNRIAFTLDQVSAILHHPWDSYDAWLYALTAAATGMREAEVRALRRDSLHDKYIDVDLQYKQREGLFPLKTKDARKVPICPKLFELLDKHTAKKRFTFDNGKGVPYGVKYIVNKFDAIVEELYPEDRAANNLVFHSLRHFYNTYLQAENVPVNKVDAVIGHSSGKGSMTQRYTDWSPEMFPEVYEAQEKLLKIIS